MSARKNDTCKNRRHLALNEFSAGDRQLAGEAGILTLTASIAPKFFWIPSYISGVAHFLGRGGEEFFSHMTIFFNPTIDWVATVYLRRWCMPCVFVVGIHRSGAWMPGSFGSVWWNACVYIDQTLAYTLLQKFCTEWNEEPCQLQEKNPLYGRVEPAKLYHTEQWAQHTIDLVILASSKLVSRVWRKAESHCKLTKIIVIFHLVYNYTVVMFQAFRLQPCECIIATHSPVC